jgi:hypothetical protein
MRSHATYASSLNATYQQPTHVDEQPSVNNERRKRQTRVHFCHICHLQGVHKQTTVSTQTTSLEPQRRKNMHTVSNTVQGLRGVHTLLGVKQASLTNTYERAVVKQRKHEVVRGGALVRLQDHQVTQKALGGCSGLQQHLRQQPHPTQSITRAPGTASHKS